MTLEEFVEIVSVLKAVYTDPKFLPDKAAIKVWYSMLNDIEPKVMKLAVQKYMMTCKYIPTIADLREKAEEVITEGVSNEEEPLEGGNQPKENE